VAGSLATGIQLKPDYQKVEIGKFIQNINFRISEGRGLALGAGCVLSALVASRQSPMPAEQIFPKLNAFYRRPR
jgi:hypothetical protein